MTIPFQIRFKHARAVFFCDSPKARQIEGQILMSQLSDAVTTLQTAASALSPAGARSARAPCLRSPGARLPPRHEGVVEEPLRYDVPQDVLVQPGQPLPGVEDGEEVARRELLGPHRALEGAGRPAEPGCGQLLGLDPDLDRTGPLPERDEVGRCEGVQVDDGLQGSGPRRGVQLGLGTGPGREPAPRSTMR